MQATPAAEAILGSRPSLSALNAMPLAAAALAGTKSNGAIERGTIALERIGMDTSTVLLATLTRVEKAVQQAVETPAPAKIEEPANIEVPAPVEAHAAPPVAEARRRLCRNWWFRFRCW